MAEVIHLTNDTASALPVPAAGWAEYRDDQTPGLRIRVYATGRRAWHYYAWHGPGPVRRAIGTLPPMAASTARAAALRLAVEFAGGAPAAATRRTAPAVTVRALWAMYCEAEDPRVRPKTRAERAQVWRRHLSAWARHPAASITRAMVQRLRDQIGKEHPTTANRVVKVARALFFWALDRGMVTANPCSRVKMFRERSRERFLQPAEAARFMAAVQAPETPARVRRFVLLALYTGQRRGNVLAMRWQDLDLQTGLWTVPGERTKNGDPLTVPLLPQAVAVLAEARADVPEACPWVLPCRDGAPVSEPKRAWASLLRRADIEGLHIHDLRRTLGSWMAMQGASTALIGRALGHRDPKATAVYARLTTDPVAAAMAQAVAALESAATPPAETPS